MTRFFLIRHAANDVSGHSFAGRSPGIDLNEAGRAQAAALASRFAGVPVAAVCSSPLERAVQTATPIATVLGMRTSTREEFLELDTGDWTGRRFDSLDGDPHFRRFNALRSCSGAPGGELMVQAQARVVAGLEALRCQYPGQTVVVVSHGDMIRAALAHCLGMPLELMLRLVVDMGSVSIVEVGDDAVQVLAVNDTGRGRFG
ncbi:histidine phosphatase family protein [Lysobacter sp. GX 14042]|uniref:histidine phosphatase family protein n=1 Tax=Lysobacter sp. GX 14042 TaxID=2907155 RepID=UPI001F478AFE|nr:histidine phosphatase family protein [Lysobacter sp. GX 14042]MCE7032272.1 histidine phosphatase family protein [Lysobacter sp. GX 14042]